MALALYRKYRPQTFADVVGQENITGILKNQVKEKAASHAYLFTGTRGTGKTTCARILSRAINCLSPVDGEPCNECEVCRGLLDGSLTDVIEIDAASNSGVENIRQMREEVDFLPVLANYKIYIIDEVHMLSPSAFNALLKTLEEPPSHVIFILATTELHKIPATILSRCQRFDFRRISSKQIAERLELILSEEGKSLPSESVALISNLGDGSMRDAVSILEKVVELEDHAQIENVLGVVGKERIYELMENVASDDFASICTVISELYNSSKDMSVLCAELLKEFRNVLVVKSVKNFREMIECTEKDAERLSSLASRFSSEHILYAMSLLQDTAAKLSKSGDKRTDIEICLLRMTAPQLKDDMASVVSRIEKLESAINSGAFDNVVKADKKPASETKRADPVSVEAAPVKTEKTARPVKEERAEAPKKATKLEPVKKAPVSAPSSDGGVQYREFEYVKDVADSLKDTDRYLALTLRNLCSAVCKGRDLILLCPSEEEVDYIKTPSNIEKIKAALEKNRITGYEISVKTGNMSEYIGTDDTYKNIESNDLFHFED